MPDQTPAVLSVESYAQGYAEAVARLRDDARYNNWWMSSDAKPDGPIRQHLADYLEAVGPDITAPVPGSSRRAQDDPMPVFVIKAKDEFALAAIRAYRALCDEHGLRDQAREVGKAHREMREWRARHPELTKLPDHKHVPAGESQASEQPIDLDDRTPRPARSTRFQSAVAGRPLDLVSFTAGSGRQYEGERSDACPGDGVPGHRHYIGCIRPPSPPKPPAGRPQTFA